MENDDMRAMITYNERIRDLKAEFTRTQMQFATAIQELEGELQRMKDNERVPQELVTKKDSQIETLIQYNDRVDDLLHVYRLSLFNLQAELLATNSMLWDAMKSERSAFEVLMHQHKKIAALKTNVPL
jgi:hypothetical protein